MLTGSYDPTFVVLSIVIATMASYAGDQIASLIQKPFTVSGLNLAVRKALDAALPT